MYLTISHLSLFNYYQKSVFSWPLEGILDNPWLSETSLLKPFFFYSYTLQRVAKVDSETYVGCRTFGSLDRFPTEQKFIFKFINESDFRNPIHYCNGSKVWFWSGHMKEIPWSLSDKRRSTKALKALKGSIFYPMRRIR